MLLEKSRAAHLKQLQPLAEMKEYLDFMSSTSEQPPVVAMPRGWSVLLWVESVVVHMIIVMFMEGGVELMGEALFFYLSVTTCFHMEFGSHIHSVS